MNPRPRYTRWELHASVAMLGLLAAFLLIAVGLMLWPYNVNTIDSFVVPSAITRGVQTHYTIVGCKHMDLVGEVTVTIENSDNYTLFTTVGATTAGECPHKVVKDFIAPTFLEPGEHRLHISIVYHPNLFKTVVVQKYSNAFQVR